LSSVIHQQRTGPVTTEDLIIAHRDTPLGLSAGDVGRALFAGAILVAAFDSHPAGPPGTNVFDGKTPMSFAGAADKHGRLWAYAYTSRPEFRRAFPQGVHRNAVRRLLPFGGQAGQICRHPVQRRLGRVVPHAAETLSAGPGSRRRTG
jgi:hypothetical protein